METSVAIVQTRPETVLADYARLLRLAGLVGADSAPVALALCLDLDREATSALPCGASPPWQLEGVLSGLLAADPAPRDVVVRLPAGAGRGGEAPRCWQAVLAAHGLPAARPGGAVLDDRRALLPLAALRTDRRLGVPGCLGTLAGHLLAPAAASLATDRFAGLLIDAWRRLPPGAVAGGVIDAAVCGAGCDAATRRPLAAHVLLAGRDPVAVDVAAARLFGFAPADLPLAQAAAAARLGVADPARIAIVGDRLDAAPLLDLTSAVQLARGSGGVLGRVERWRFDLSVRLSGAARRARRGRRRYAATAWGRLQEAYVREGSLAGKGSS